MTYYAHTTSSPDHSDWQTLEEHLENVGNMAASFAEPFGMAPWARAAGYLHDYGKACDEFQRRLDGKHPPFDHAIAGAVRACDTLATTPVHEGSFISPIIAGHHGGLMDYASEVPDSLLVRMDTYGRGAVPRVDESASAPEMAADPEPGLMLSRVARTMGPAQTEFLSFGAFALGHLLFSSLVDADWLDTERVMSPEAYACRNDGRSAQDTLETLAGRLNAHLSTFTSDTPVNAARAEMLNDARTASCLPPGIFEMEMPTGAGKTLTSMAFALGHALANGQDRIIYAIPFQSIVEQNARVFKDVLGCQNVIEHVSSYDFGLAGDLEGEADEAMRMRGQAERMLSQNWDGPIVVTTNVQLFESLFSCKTSRARKVHNIANSVIVLDEVQALPDSLLKPTLAMLEALVKLAHVSVVLCSATQPALDSLWPFGTKPTAIVTSSKERESVFSHRVVYDISHADKDEAYSLDDLADELEALHQVLCVVSSRRAARMLYDSILSRREQNVGVYHLSALMVPSHRTDVLAAIRSRLKVNLPCVVVSTQLVEAGVDLDFPVVYREMTGIDSILQAAGRCNREGRMADPGRVVVFACEDFDQSRPTRKNWLSRTRQLGEEALYGADDGSELFGPDMVREYFRRRHQTGPTDGADNRSMYDLIVGEKDLQTIKAHVQEGRLPYRTVSDRYRFIADDTVGIFVPWGAQGERLLSCIEGRAFTYDMYPLLQRHIVSLPFHLFKAYEQAGALRRMDEFPIPILETRAGSERLYDDERGLLSPGEGDLDVLVVV